MSRLLEDAGLFAIAAIVLLSAPAQWAWVLSQAETWEATGLALAFAPAVGLSLWFAAPISFALVEVFVAMHEDWTDHRSLSMRG